MTASPQRAAVSDELGSDPALKGGFLTTLDARKSWIYDRVADKPAVCSDATQRPLWPVQSISDWGSCVFPISLSNTWRRNSCSQIAAPIVNLGPLGS